MGAIDRGPTARAASRRHALNGTVAPTPGRGAAAREVRSLRGASKGIVAGLAAHVGNRAVQRALQRAAGWSKPQRSDGWNAKARQIAPSVEVWRIPIEGLPGGNQTEFLGPDSGSQTSESAVARAIVLVPKTLNPKAPVEVLLHFHGHAEGWRKRYPGWRERSNDNTVRDVALDQIGQQIEATGNSQLLGILPQGGEQSQFCKKSIKGLDKKVPARLVCSPTDFDADTYVGEVLKKTADDEPNKLKTEPTDRRVVLSAHSGGGFTVSAMLGGTGSAKQPKKLAGVVLFEANGMSGKMKLLLDRDLVALKAAASDADRVAYLKGSPRVQAFYQVGGPYDGAYQALQTEITTWFKRNAKDLAGLDKTVLVDGKNVTATLRAHYTVNKVDRKDVSHEQMLRGTPDASGDKYVKGSGNLEAALRSIG